MMSLHDLFETLKGGSGSGHHDHVGRHAQRGGSAPKGGMGIDKFNELLKQKNPNGSAYVPEKSGVRQTKVVVQYDKDGKGYTYSGTIREIAKRIGILPEVDVQKESAGVVAKFIKGEEEVVGHSILVDTIRHMHQVPGKSLLEESAGVDEYGEELSRFSFGENPWV